jgi:hypothetical protein
MDQFLCFEERFFKEIGQRDYAPPVSERFYFMLEVSSFKVKDTVGDGISLLFFNTVPAKINKPGK